MVRSQLHAPAVLPWRKAHHCMGDWVDLEPVWMPGAEQKTQPPQGIKPRLSGRSSHGVATLLIETSRGWYRQSVWLVVAARRVQINAGYMIHVAASASLHMNA